MSSKETPKHDALLQEYLKEEYSYLSDEVKALRMSGNIQFDYIDVEKYVYWLEDKIIKLQSINNVKRTK